jgi:hypothetical protein
MTLCNLGPGFLLLPATMMVMSSLGGCFGCTSSPGQQVPMKPALSIMRYRFFDPVSQQEYASGCAVDRNPGVYNVSVAVPLNVQYSADIYGELLTDDSGAGVDSRPTEEICADSFVFYTNGLEQMPWCVRGLMQTSLVDLHAVDMSGIRIDNPTSDTIGGARYTVISSGYGPAEFLSSGSGCPDGYTYGYWDVVASN